MNEKIAKKWAKIYQDDTLGSVTIQEVIEKAITEALSLKEEEEQKLRKQIEDMREKEIPDLMAQLNSQSEQKLTLARKVHRLEQKLNAIEQHSTPSPSKMTRYPFVNPSHPNPYESSPNPLLEEVKRLRNDRTTRHRLSIAVLDELIQFSEGGK